MLIIVMINNSILIGTSCTSFIIPYITIISTIIKNVHYLTILSTTYISYVKSDVALHFNKSFIITLIDIKC